MKIYQKEKEKNEKKLKLKILRVQQSVLLNGIKTKVVILLV